MMPHERIRDLMRRTMFNLHVIDAQATKEGPYEVTQLVNSFLAALAHPWEEYKQDLHKRSIPDAIATGWPELAKEQASDDEPESLGDLLRLVRNAFAHGNLAFLNTGGNEITHIRFWNNNRKGERTWGAIAGVDSMRLFLDKFVELAENLSESDVRNVQRKTA
jgi:hypothetical protein